MTRMLMLLVLCAPGARADLEPTHVIDRRADDNQRAAAKLASDAAKALAGGDFDGAVELTKRALATSSTDPWAHYIHAEALVRQGHVDDALPEYRVAEQALPREERWSRSIVLWGRANALYQTGRCAEAKAAFNDYVSYVSKDDRAAADMAQKHIDDCKPPWVNPLSKPAAPPNP
jgi:Tfp pilus assembly protein PilF